MCLAVLRLIWSILCPAKFGQFSVFAQRSSLAASRILFRMKRVSLPYCRWIHAHEACLEGSSQLSATTCTVRSGSNDSHISQKLWNRIIRWMDQLIEQREKGQFGFSEAGVEEHWCYYYWRSHIQETNHYSGNNSHPNRARPPDAIRFGLCRVPYGSCQTLVSAPVEQHK